MARFSITDAAFEGFRLTRERPGVVAVWTVVQVVFAVGAGVVMMRLPAFGHLQTELAAGGEPDLPKLQALFSELMPAFFTLMMAALVVDAVLKAGVYRIVLRRGGPLGLGADEFRILLVSLASGLLAVIPVMLGAILMGLLIRVGAAPIGLLAYIASFGLMAVIYVRLSMAGPMTITEGRVSVLASASLTKGFGWRLFGTYFLAIVLYIVVALLVGAVEGGLRGVLGIKAVASEINAASIAGLVIQGLVAGLGVAIVQAPAAHAYRQITGTPEEADAF